MRIRLTEKSCAIAGASGTGEFVEGRESNYDCVEVMTNETGQI